MAGKHVLKLAPRRVYFYDPVSGLFLRYPDKVVGEVPFGADIKNIKRAVLYGSLIDVGGTVLAEIKDKQPKVEQADDKEPKEEPKAEVVKEEAPAEVREEEAAEPDKEEKVEEKPSKRKRK